MKKILLTISILLLVLQPAYTKHQHLEKEYQQYWCNAKGGQLEYRLPDETRVDCLLPNLAVEFDFANKWAECIGQALYYGKRTGKTPTCVLIMENSEKDIKYLKRLRYTVYNHKIIPAFKIFTIRPEQLYTDFEISDK